MTQKTIDQITQQTGAQGVFYNPEIYPNHIPIYNEGQQAFLAEFLKYGHRDFQAVEMIFATKAQNCEAMWDMYINADV